MAKRKRLTPANPALFGALPDAGHTPPGTAGLPPAPIAAVASDAAASAALDQMAQELTAAREGGRMVLELTLDQIVLDHLVRDRVTADADELDVLKNSIAARGQQHPVEVMALDAGRYGLISGWRRCQAIRALAEEGRHDGQVLALLRKPSEASDAYLSMVEENEIRVGLSYFERARIALKAVEQGVFETEKAALLTLFANASRPKRSKIRAFLPIVATLDGRLSYPQLIGERLGLRLSAALERDPDLARRLTEALVSNPPTTGEGEQALLQAHVAQVEAQEAKAPTQTSEPKTPDGRLPKDPLSAPLRQAVGTDLEVTWNDAGDWMRIAGPRMSPALRARIIELIRRIPR